MVSSASSISGVNGKFRSPDASQDTNLRLEPPHFWFEFAGTCSHVRGACILQTCPHPRGNSSLECSALYCRPPCQPEEQPLDRGVCSSENAGPDSYMQRHFASAFLRAFFGLLLLSGWGVSVLGEGRPQHPTSPAMSFAAVNHGAGNALYLGTTSATVELSLRCEQNSKRPRPKIYSTPLATPNAGAPPRSARAQTLPRTRPDVFAPPQKLCPPPDDDDPILS